VEEDGEKLGSGGTFINSGPEKQKELCPVLSRSK
jgi:hypothetical protein